jgi:hypothetical protein
MKKRVKKRFDIDITGAGASQSKTFELDKNITAVHGLLITSDRDDLLYYRGSQKIELNRQEIFPENYESKLLMSGINVSPNDRYYNLSGLAPGNAKLTMTYADSNHVSAPFVPYRVSIYLDCEMDETI